MFHAGEQGQIKEDDFILNKNINEELLPVILQMI